MRKGVRLGIDVGRARVGVARCDRDGLLAVPVETVPRNDEAVRRIIEIAKEYGAIEAVVGLPMSLSGADTASTSDARRFAEQLARLLTVRLIDERLSTVSAQAGMRAVGRKAKQQRTVIDQAAAVVILQHALDSERSTGTAAGTVVVAEAPDSSANGSAE